MKYLTTLAIALLSLSAQAQDQARPSPIYEGDVMHCEYFGTKTTPYLYTVKVEADYVQVISNLRGTVAQYLIANQDVGYIQANKPTTKGKTYLSLNSVTVDGKSEKWLDMAWIDNDMLTTALSVDCI